MTDHAAGDARPIILHGLWRSGSTYAWSRFRAADGTYAYFEQLYPGLARLTPARAARPAWREAVAANRHPDLETPYFAEYLPLLGRRGVKGFDRRFAFDRFVLSAGDSHEPLRLYLARLIDFAAEKGLRPVLGCNRTWLRIPWIKESFSSFDVHVERDPVAIWGSYRRHAKAGTYDYFINLHLILERNADHPLFAPMAALTRLRRGVQRLAKAKQVYPALIEAMTAEESYGLVFYMWALAALSGLSHCDLVLDTEAPDQAARAEAAVREGCGLNADFSGVRPRDGSDPAPARAAEVERAILGLLPSAALARFCDPSRARGRIDQLAPAKAERLRPLLDILGAPVSPAIIAR